MKIHHLFVLAGWLAASSLSAQTAEQFYSQGTNFLAQHELAHANASFSNALVLSPNHQRANALTAATRLALLFDRPSAQKLMDRLGLSAFGRDLFAWSSDFKRDPVSDSILMAPDLSSDEGLALARNEVLPEVVAALNNLARVTDTNLTIALSEDQTGADAVTVDYGDMMLCRAWLHALEFALHTLQAHNFSVWIAQLKDAIEAENFSLEKLLADYPALLAPANTPSRAASRTAFTNAIARYLTASDFVRHVRPANAERLFNLDTNDLPKEEDFRFNLGKLRDSVNAPTKWEPDDTTSLYLGAYFNGASSLRGMLPKFQGNHYVPASAPDYTFGGVLGNPQADTEKMLVDQFGKEAFRINSFSENFTGTFWYDAGSGDLNSVEFDAYSAAFNATATLSGVDVDDFNTNTFIELLLGRFTLQGNLSDDLSYTKGKTSATLAFGYFDWGSLTWVNVGRLNLSWTPTTMTLSCTASQVPLNGDDTYGFAWWDHVESPGAFKTNLTAGLHLWWDDHDGGEHWTAYTEVPSSGTTTFSTNSSNHEVTGTIRTTGQTDATLPTVTITTPAANARWSNHVITVTGTAADNNILDDVVVWVNGGPFLEATPGNNFSNWTAQVSLWPGSNVISAQSRDWFGNRSAIASVKVSYVITGTLTLLTNGPGTITRNNFTGNTLEVGQNYTVTAVPAAGNRLVNWTDGSDAVVSATAAYTFTMISNLTLRANFADGVAPTLTITNPVANQRVSSALAMIQGTASDNAGVTEVWLKLNNEPWELGHGTMNWHRPTTLTPGLNTVWAYAQDAAGNRSVTQQVAFTYVVSGTLVVQTNGVGSVTPNLNGQLLEIGKPYQMTAAGLNGFTFTNWASNQGPGTNRPAL
ncbi:MAG: Ig-like domain-containing protein, partial [Verrucomicrobia bacterium]|nr:Ig-like domain-containing protein [Verrucomicrobiota bacterium]